jgi:hypothetical protein
MALQREVKQLVFTQGLDTKANPDVVPIGTLHALENAQFKQLGKISKKNGTVLFGTSTQNSPVDGGTVPPFKSAFGHKGGVYAIGGETIASDPINYASPDNLYGWSPSLNKWTHTGRAACVSAKTKQASTKDFVVTLGGPLLAYLPMESTGTSDTLYCNGYYFQATALTQSGPTYLDIIDASTDETIHSARYDIARPKLIRVGNLVNLIGVNLANILSYQFNTASLTFAPTAVQLATTYLNATTSMYDVFVAPINNNVYLAFTSTAPNITINRYATIPASGAVVVTNTVTSAFIPTKALCIFGGDSTFQKIIVAYSRAGIGVQVDWYTTALGGAISTTVYGYEARALTGSTEVCPISGRLVMLGEFDSSAVENYLNISPFYLNATTCNPFTFLTTRTCTLSLASKIKLVGNRWVFLVVTSDPNERTYFLCYLPLNSIFQVGQIRPLAKLLFGEAGYQFGGTTPLGSMLPQLSSGSVSTSLHCAGLKRSGVGAPPLDRYLPMMLSFDFDSRNKYQSREVAGLTYLNGGFPMCFDGGNLFEAQFLHSPLTPDQPVPSVGAGALTPSSTYQICTIFEYADTSGARHQSSPSVPVSVALAAGQNTISVRVFPPAVSMHNLARIVVYRTTSNGSIFYRDQDVIQACCGAPYPTPIVCLLSDANLSQREILYTTGGVLENHCPVSTTQVIPWRKRIWALTDDGVNYSKEITEGVPAAFNAELSLDLGAAPAAPTGIAALQDKLLVFTRDDIYVVFGDGPDDTGTIGSFSGPDLVTTGIGCVNGSSIIEVGDKVFFQSRDGWRSVNQALQVEFIGDQLQHYVSENSPATYGCYLDAQHEVRFSDGTRTYVYDTTANQWIINPPWNDIRGFLWTPKTGNRSYVRLNSSGVLSFEDSSTSYDNAVHTTFRVLTGWIPLGQFQGYGRFYELLILGRLDPMTIDEWPIRVRLYYDYVPQVVETFYATAGPVDPFIAPARYTDAQVYEDNSFAGNALPFQVKVKPSVQKAQAIRIEISDAEGYATEGRWELTGLGLVIGVKGGGYKTKDSHTISGTGRPGFIP